MSSTNSWCLYHCQKLFWDDYYLNILAYCQDYLIYHDYWSNHLVPYLEQRHKVGHMNSHNQMNSHILLLCSSFLVQSRWQNSLICLWTCTDALWGARERSVCFSPALLAAPLLDGGGRYWGSWIAVSVIAWIHASIWMQASLQCKANKSVGCLCWTIWWLPQVVPGSLIETCFCKVGIVGALLSNDIVSFGKTNILETLTYKIEQCWTIFHKCDEVLMLKVLCLIGHDVSGYIQAAMCPKLEASKDYLN